MANGRNSGSDREAMLRRVAIVLSSLPSSVASQLLGSVDPQSMQTVRRTMTSLADVDPLERQRALQAFKGLMEQRPEANPPIRRTTDTIEDEVVFGQSAPPRQPTSRVVSSSVSDRFSTQSESSPLSFLSDVDDEKLVSLLAAEHPQAIALVLASIAPAQAARVLPRLDQKVQTDALSRIGRLGEIPEAAVTEVAEHLKNRVAEKSKAESSATGRLALDAILAALPSPDAGGAATMDSTSAEKEEVVTSPKPSVAPVNFPSADLPAIDLTHKLRVAEHTWPDPPVDPHDETPSENPSSENRIPGDPFAVQQARTLRAEQLATEHANVLLDRTPSFESTDAIHQHLLRLSPAQLCQALGRIETRDALLALCGLPNHVAESVFEVLPREHAKRVRIQMTSLGSLHLREIDEAKEKVAHASLSSSDETPQVPLAA